MPTCAERSASRTAAMANHSEKKTLLSETSCSAGRYHQALQEFLKHALEANNALVADTERGTRGFLQREASSGAQQLNKRHSAGDCVPLLSGAWETRRALLATQPSCPPGLEAPQPHQEQRSSRMVRVGDTYSGVLATRAVENGHLPVVDGDLLFQTRGSADLFATRNQPPIPSASLPRRPTTEIQDVRGQRHCRVALSLVRELALDSSSSRSRKPHGTCIQLQLSRLLAGVELEIRSQCPSMRTAGTAPQVLPPPARIVSTS